LRTACFEARPRRKDAEVRNRARYSGAGSLTPDQVQGISQKSCGVLKELGLQIQWVHRYVTQDKIYCVYIAPNEEMVREHAQKGGFPANRISEVSMVIDPTTAEAC
jgi:hypothetical protein